LFIINDLAFQIPFIGGLVAGDGDELIEVRPQGMGQGLVVMGIIGYRIIMLIRERTDDIGFQLQVQVLHIESIDVFHPQLQTLLVGPVALRIMQDLVKNKFIDQQLPVELNGVADIGLKIQPDRCFVRTTVLLLGGNQEDNRVQVGEIIMIRAAENDILV